MSQVTGCRRRLEIARSAPRHPLTGADSRVPAASVGCTRPELVTRYMIVTHDSAIAKRAERRLHIKNGTVTDR